MAKPPPNPDTMTPREARHLLTLPDTATWGEVQRRYRHLALRVHPDKGGSAEKFQLLTAAFRALSPPDATRAAYAKSYFVPSPDDDADAVDPCVARGARARDRARPPPLGV